MRERPRSLLLLLLVWLRVCKVRSLVGSVGDSVVYLILLCIFLWIALLVYLREILTVSSN